MRLSKLMMPAVLTAGALALAGCGGGGGTTTPPAPPACDPEGDAPFEATDGKCYADEAAYETAKEQKEFRDKAIVDIAAADGAARDLEEGDDLAAVQKLIDDAEASIANLTDESERETLMEGLDTAKQIVGLFIDNSLLEDELEEKEGELTAATNEAGATGTVFNRSRETILALDEARKLLTAATEASGRLKAQSKGVNGSSKAVYDNALNVLGARDKILAEHGKAVAAVAALEGIATDDLSETAKTLVGDAVTLAKGRRDAIKAIVDASATDTGTLAAAERTVKGNSAETDSAKIAMAWANSVASTMKGKIEARTTALEAIAGIQISPAGAPKGAVNSEGASGQTFAQIAGAASLNVTAALSDDIDQGDGTETEIPNNGSIEAFYRGIEGRLVCTGGAVCTVAGIVGGTSAGNVTFVPDHPSDIYSAPTPNDDYAPVQNAATYGSWLDSDGDIVLHADSLTNDNSALNWHRPTSATANVTAKYSGKAHGYSQREYDKTKKASGAFSADVNLTATFRDTTENPYLSGRISGFTAEGSGTDHVNPNWAIALDRMTIDPVVDTAQRQDLTNRTDGDVYGGAQVGATDGAWTAHAYGPVTTPTASRPTGFVGGFAATFGGTDESGSATGVYHADK